MRRIDADDYNASLRGEIYGEAPGLTAEGFERHVMRNDIDIARSLRFTENGILSGVALLGFRGERAWLGGFGIVPAFRRRGLGRAYVRRAAWACENMGATTFELEVMVHNAAAVGLYAGTDFRVVGDLIVWVRRALDPGAAAPPSREVAPDVPRAPASCWQREARSVLRGGPFERVLVGDAASPRAYADFRRTGSSVELLDAAAVDDLSARRLLAEVDAVLPAAELRLLNESAAGSLHDALSARSGWSVSARQFRMRRPLLERR